MYINIEIFNAVYTVSVFGSILGKYKKTVALGACINCIVFKNILYSQRYITKCLVTYYTSETVVYKFKVFRVKRT